MSFSPTGMDLTFINMRLRGVALRSDSTYYKYDPARSGVLMLANPEGLNIYSINKCAESDPKRVEPRAETNLSIVKCPLERKADALRGIVKFNWSDNKY